MKNILFYVERSLHLPFLEPIEAYLREGGLARTAFSAPPFFAGTPDIPQWGLRPEEIARLEEKTSFYPQPGAFPPHATVVADACHFRIPEIENVINVGHGMICKGAFYTDSSITRRENLSQMLLVPGPWHRSRLASNVAIPIKVTGFIKSDQLFGPAAQTRAEFCERLGIDSGKRIVLFAPTYNPELSAMHCVAEGIRKVADQDTVLLIKLHNMTDARFKDLYSNIASAHPNIFYLTDADYSGMMHAADLMISDVSSIFIEFLLLDKPVVLFNNPRIKEFPYYNAEDIEYKTRDAAVQVASLDELLRAVRTELAHPEKRSAIRQRYAMALDHGRDGRSAERAGQAILEWVNDDSRPELTVALLEPVHAGQEEIARDLAELKKAPWRLHIGVFGGQEKIEGAQHHITGMFDLPALRDFLRSASTKRVVAICGGLRMPRDWPKWLENHFHWNPKVGAIKALTDPLLADQCMRQLSRANRTFTDQEALSFGLLMSGIGQSAPAKHLPSECIMLDATLTAKIPEALPVNDPEEFITALGLVAAAQGKETRLAFDCYMPPFDCREKLLRRMQTLRKQGNTAEAAIIAEKLASF
jgi:hypothetical protein